MTQSKAAETKHTAVDRHRETDVHEIVRGVFATALQAPQGVWDVTEKTEDEFASFQMSVVA